MKRLLMAAAAAAMLLGDAFADNHTYTYSYYDEDFEQNVPYTGMLRRVSPNGRWAVGGDEDMMDGGYIIDTDEPELIVFSPDGCMLDVNNDGMAVGTYYTHAAGGGVYKSAGIYRNGEWQQLPLPEESIGTSQAVAISADSKRIAGHALCSSGIAGEPGRYFPVTWKLNEATGEYELDTLYNNLYLPGTYGFFVYAMTPNGRYICGQQNLDFGDCIAAMLDTETGELKIWHKIEIRDWYFEAAGGTFPTMFVDNVMDGWDAEAEYFLGRILYANNRYLFGTHAVVESVDEATGEGHVENYAAVYDLEAKTWIDGSADLGSYLCGNSPDEVFTTSGDLVRNGQVESINSVVKGTDRVDGIYGIDNSGKVWVGSQVVMSPLGEMVETPVLVMMEKSEIGAVGKVTDFESNPEISVSDGVISINGASRADIYRIDGSHVASGLNATVAPGVYVIKADTKSFKIIVK